jgi:hypothetical protein
MEARYSSEMSIHFQRISRTYILEDTNLQYVFRFHEILQIS